MKLSREELKDLRDSGGLSNSQFLSMAKTLAKEMPLAKEPKENPLKDLVAIITDIGNKIKEPRSSESLLPTLQAIDEGIKSLVLATIADTKSRNKKREIFPDYRDGKIVKITII